MKALVFLFLLFLGISHAQADPVRIRESYCSDASLSQIQSALTQYSSYSSQPGADYRIALLGKDLSLIRMIKSQSRLREDGQVSDVWIVMQPAIVEEAALYPRFLLECKGQKVRTNMFEHRCFQQNHRQHFGLRSLEMNVQVIEGSKKCKASQTLVELTVNMEGEPNDISQIKGAVLKGAGVLEPLISPLFNVDQFFRNYFENLYDKWMRSIR